jgi:hypothetical protein
VVPALVKQIIAERIGDDGHQLIERKHASKKKVFVDGEQFSHAVILTITNIHIDSHKIKLPLRSLVPRAAPVAVNVNDIDVDAKRGAPPETANAGDNEDRNGASSSANLLSIEELVRYIIYLGKDELVKGPEKIEVRKCLNSQKQYYYVAKLAFANRDNVKLAHRYVTRVSKQDLIITPVPGVIIPKLAWRSFPGPEKFYHDVFGTDLGNTTTMLLPCRARSLSMHDIYRRGRVGNSFKYTGGIKCRCF